MLVSVIYGSFNSYWAAQVYGILKRDDAAAIFGRIQTYTTLGLVFICMGLVVAAKPMLRLMTTPAYYGAARLVPLIVLAYFIRSMGDFFRSLYYVSGHPGADAACNWLGAAICLTGYFLLIPRFGVWGAAEATVIAFALIATVCLTWTHRLWPYRLDTVRLSKIGLAALAVLVPYSLVNVTSLIGQIAWGGAVMLAFPVLLWMMRFPSPGERDAMASAVRRVLRFGAAAA